jgi:hypothetical protein
VQLQTPRVPAAQIDLLAVADRSSGSSGSCDSSAARDRPGTALGAAVCSMSSAVVVGGSIARSVCRIASYDPTSCRTDDGNDARAAVSTAIMCS